MKSPAHRAPTLGEKNTNELIKVHIKIAVNFKAIKKDDEIGLHVPATAKKDKVKDHARPVLDGPKKKRKWE